MLGGGFRNYFMYKSACFCIFVVILRFTTAAGDVNYKVRVFERVFLEIFVVFSVGSCQNLVF